MEPRIDIQANLDPYRPVYAEGPHAYFAKAWAFTNAFYKNELQVIASRRFDAVTPEQVFHEHMWVVHATGFNARVVGTMMPKLVAAYGSFRNVAALDFEFLYGSRIQPICAHKGKSKAIWEMARLLVEGEKFKFKEDQPTKFDKGWLEWKRDNLSTPALLQKLPFIGPVTCYHLARNIGLLDVVKPDLHLERLAAYWGFKSSLKMCETMQARAASTFKLVQLGVVDLCVWYLASTFGTKELKKEGDR